MAVNNFEACHAVTAKYEGGFVNHPSDPGGATNWGITRAVLADWRGRPVSVADVKAMPYAEALLIFRKRFWNTVGAENMPKGVDLACYDWGVNSGPARGRKAYADTAGILSPPARVKQIMALRRGFYAAIIAKNGKLAAFRKGWANRAAGVEAIAYKWALAAQGMKPAEVTRQMQAEAATAQQTAAKNGPERKSHQRPQITGRARKCETGADIHCHQDQITGHHLGKDAAQRLDAGDVNHPANETHHVKARPHIA